MGKSYAAMQTKKIESITVTLTLDTRRITDKIPVAVRVNYDGRNYYYRTGYRCTLSEWEKLCKATGKGQSIHGKTFKTKLEQIAIFDKVCDHVRELLKNDVFSVERLKVALTGKHDTTFNSFWKEIADSKKIGTQYSYLTALNSFTKHVGNKVEFNKLGETLIEKWRCGMEKDNLSVTSIGVYFRACRVVFRAGIKRGLIRGSQYPFGQDRIKIKKGRLRRNEFLTVDKIKKLMSFQAPDSWHKGYTEAVYQAIDLWLFSYLGNGMNLADIALLRWNEHYFNSDQTELCFSRKKTSDTTDNNVEIIVPIIPELQSILNRRASTPELGKPIFPFILENANSEINAKKAITQWNSNIQDRVKKICKVIGINENVSMTWARHSFASNLTFAGVPERYISEAMGHSVKNVTQGYIGLFSPEKRREFNEKLLI